VNPRDRLLELVLFHLTLHQRVALQDVYKLFYQGVFGAEHLLKDVDAARRYLETEWQTVAPDPSKPLLEPVSTDGGVVRVNIARCKVEGISCESVWFAFLHSNVFRGDVEAFKSLWLEFINLCRQKRLPFDSDQAVNYFNEMEARRFPVQHHSENYRIFNRPAYRVVGGKSFAGHYINLGYEHE